MSPLPNAAQDPLILAALAAVLVLALHYQRGLTYREYMTAMRVKRRLFPLLDRLKPAGYGAFVFEKPKPTMSPEYITTSNASLRTLWRRFTDAGGSPHLVSSVKRRADGSLSILHFVWQHDNTEQTEVYVFPDGVVYAHRETSVVDPDGHLSDGGTPGDPEGVLDGVVL